MPVWNTRESAAARGNTVSLQFLPWFYLLWPGGRHRADRETYLGRPCKEMDRPCCSRFFCACHVPSRRRFNALQPNRPTRVRGTGVSWSNGSARSALLTRSLLSKKIKIRPTAIFYPIMGTTEKNSTGELDGSISATQTQQQPLQPRGPLQVQLQLYITLPNMGSAVGMELGCGRANPCRWFIS